MKKFKVGSKVTIIADTVNHGIPLGGVYIIERVENNNRLFLTAYPGVYLTPRDVKAAFLTEEDIKEEISSEEAKIKNANDEIAILKSKLDYLSETKSKNFDENEFKAYHALKIIENSDLSLIEKTKFISKLFDN